VLWQRVAHISIFLFLTGALASARDLALVSNKTNHLSQSGAVLAITLPDLVKVCKAQINHWPDGKPVTFVMRSPSTPEMKVVLEKLYGMSESEVKGLIVTSNNGRPGHPAILVVNSDDELVDKVASLPGAIGVVDVYSINSSVVVVKIAGKLPLEPGYLLHGN
jgi:hypothetical protein